MATRALRFLDRGPGDSTTLAREVLGIQQASTAIADRVMVALLGSDPRVRRLGDGRWALVLEPAGSPKLSMCAFAVVDVETTGAPWGHGGRVTEIAVVALADGSVELVYQALVNPGCPIPEVITSLTRITNEMVKNQPTFSDIADDVIGALAGRVFAAHNVRFDWSFVSSELCRARDVVLDGPSVCTRNLARRLIPELRSRGLDSVAAYLGIEITERHRARADALAAARILRQLLRLAEEQGATSLADLERLGRRRRRKSALPTSVREI